MCEGGESENTGFQVSTTRSMYTFDVDAVLVGKEEGGYEDALVHVIDRWSNRESVLYELSDMTHTTHTYMRQEDAEWEFEKTGFYTTEKPVKMRGLIDESPKEVFGQYETGEEPTANGHPEIPDESGWGDEDETVRAAREVIEENPDAVDDYLGGEDEAISFLVARVMSKTGGSADPGTVNEVLREELTCPRCGKEKHKAAYQLGYKVCDGCTREIGIQGAKDWGDDDD